MSLIFSAHKNENFSYYLHFPSSFGAIFAYFFAMLQRMLTFDGFFR
jgi:hypothetical protein